MPNLKKLVVVTGASALLAVVTLTGCQMTNRSTDRTAGRALDDKMITQQVQVDLKREPVYKFNDVDVKTFGGVVQLSGFVSTEEQKRRAGEIAQRTEGVAQVVNNITLKPSGGTNLAPTGRTNNVNQVNEPQRDR